MNLLSSVITATLLSSAAVAQANVTQWLEHDAVEFAAVVQVADSNGFADYFTFHLSPAAGLVSTSVSNNILDITHISDGWVDLYAGTYGDLAADTLVGGYGFNGVTGDTANVFSSLTAGNYYYKVTGKADGQYGGFYSISSYAIAPVPEPETYALLLLGLGATVIARRCKATR